MSHCDNAAEILTWEQYSQAVLEMARTADDSHLTHPATKLADITSAVCGKLRKLGQNSQLLPALRQPRLLDPVIDDLGEAMWCCVILQQS